jgi:hypothetical protein
MTCHVASSFVKMQCAGSDMHCSNFGHGESACVGDFLALTISAMNKSMNIGNWWWAA